MDDKHMMTEHAAGLELSCARMHGAGNSFVVIDNMNEAASVSQLSEIAVELCARYKADGILVTVPVPAAHALSLSLPESRHVSSDGQADKSLPTDMPKADFGMIYYNSDGSLGEMCGNGARCIARFGFEHGLAADPDNIRVLATAGIVIGKRITEEQYEIHLNDPSAAEPCRFAEASGCEYACSYVTLGYPGIPHAVVLTPPQDFEDMDMLRERGRALRNSPVFPKGANVTFVRQDFDPLSEGSVHSVTAITFERGVEDFTLACGTGCGATAVSLSMWKLLTGNRVEINMPGGHLSVTFVRDGDHFSNLLLTGPTAYIES